MDDLIVSGTVALVVFYAGIVLVAFGVIWLLIFVLQCARNGNYLVFCEIAAGIVGVVLAYIITGLWLRRTGTI